MRCYWQWASTSPIAKEKGEPESCADGSDKQDRSDKRRSPAKRLPLHRAHLNRAKLESRDRQRSSDGLPT
jgi:hypothetical protein